jgi:hypothetical protein
MARVLLKQPRSQGDERLTVGSVSQEIRPEAVAASLAVLHPLEYVAMNALTGGTRGAYDKFELDYWLAAATEAVRRLEHRLDYDPSIRLAETPPNVLVCIGSRKERVHPILRRPWIVETDPD